MEDSPKINGPTLAEALGGYAGSDGARFHMPGHKGRGMGGFWHTDVMRWDVTELSFSDNLHDPETVLADAQERMAKAYGAAASFFVVNGSTAGVQAMLLSLAPGEKLLLCRDAHRCAVSGAAMAGLEPAYILPAYQPQLGLWGMVTPEELDKALTRTGATAVLITSPNYYGLCADLPGLAETAHRHGALLLVDGAHGAHFPFSPELPMAAAGYADLWVHSQHKTMNALTQAASLHVGNCRIHPDTVARMLAMIETSSPSYLLMASLDWSVFMGPRQDWTGQVRRMKALEKRLGTINGIHPLPENLGAGVADRDRTRLVLDVTQRGLTGFDAQRALEAQGVFVEMADINRLVLITSPEDDPAWYTRLEEALCGLSYARPMTDHIPDPGIYETTPKKRMGLREAAFLRVEEVPLEAAAGRIASAPIGIYPPGIALAMPGEEISSALTAYLLEEARAGAALFGLRKGKVPTVHE